MASDGSQQYAVNAIVTGRMQLPRADARVVRMEHKQWIVPIYLVFVITLMGGWGQLDYQFFQSPSSKPFLLTHLLNHHDSAILQVVEIVTLEDGDVSIKNIPIDHGIPVNAGGGKSGTIHSGPQVTVEKEARPQFYVPLHPIRRRL
jgi:hypothetical protein